jgi:hypothetical protein
MRKLFALLRRQSFSAPERNQVAILHHEDYWLRALILQELPATTVRVYPEATVVYLRPYLAWRFVLALGRVAWREALRGGKNGMFRELYCCYLIALLDQIGARTVLTHIDNSRIFQKLSRMDMRRNYFAIQNGTRTLACVRDSLPQAPHPMARISMSNLFCFGQRDVELFSAQGHHIDHYFPVGSLLGSYYKTRQTALPAVPRFDLCLISQWHPHFFGDLGGDEYIWQAARRIRRGMDGMHQFLTQLLDETDLTLAVCLRNDDAEERRFYEAMFGERAVLIPADRKNFSTYRTAEASKLAIGLNSTTLAEVFAWGNKVLWCNVPADEHLQMPEAGPAYFAGADYAAFKRQVLELVAMLPAQFAGATRSNAHFINAFDADRPAHMVIRQAVLASLSSLST